MVQGRQVLVCCVSTYTCTGHPGPSSSHRAQCRLEGAPAPALPAMRPLQTSWRVRDAPPATRGQVLPEEHPAPPLSSHPADSFHKQSAQAAAASGKNTVSQAPCQRVCTPHLPFFPQQPRRGLPRDETLTCSLNSTRGLCPSQPWTPQPQLEATCTAMPWPCSCT